MNTSWTLTTASDDQTIHSLAQSQSFPETIAKILISRGITAPEDIQGFFNPSLRDLHSPFLMDGMDKAVERIERAIANGEPIRIYGDYDVDGTVTTAMLTHFLRSIGAVVDFYIPKRFTEVYGISIDTIETTFLEERKLIIAVDTGITAIEAIEYANSLDMDVIVCDHHEPSDTLPPAFALLNPIKGTCSYPFKYLCACGVTYKLIQALCERRGIQGIEHQYLDLVAVASTADMVPLIGENRILVNVGLQQINTQPRTGLKGLLDCTNTKVGTVTSSTIVYNIAPLINAAGRMGDAFTAVELMLSEDEILAFRLAQDLESKNYRRRVIDEKTFAEASQIAEELITKEHRRSLVIYHPEWHVGVINIVASRLVERFHLPVILLTGIDNVAKGSARSIKHFDVHAALKQCAKLLKQFGGHKYAAGLSLEEKNIGALRDAFDEICRAALSETMIQPEISIDAELQFSDITPDFLDYHRQFAPFGYGNNKPCFVSHNVVSSGRANIVGKNHLRFRARQQGLTIDAIGFNLGEKLDLCNGNEPLSIVYTIEEIVYHQRVSLQLYIKDLRTTEEYRTAQVSPSPHASDEAPVESPLVPNSSSNGTLNSLAA